MNRTLTAAVVAAVLASPIALAAPSTAVGGQGGPQCFRAQGCPPGPFQPHQRPAVGVQSSAAHAAHVAHAHRLHVLHLRHTLGHWVAA